MKRFLFALLAWFAVVTLHATETRPNIVWIFGEDMGPELGAYGDSNALTPNMDRLAREGARFQSCFTHAPVCAPSRSGLITGHYPTRIGSHHMRSTLLAPTKPKEELYDVFADPDEVRNLAGLPQHKSKLKELRAVLDQWITGTKDLGAIPERELIQRGLVADRLAEYATRKEPKK